MVVSTSDLAAAGASPLVITTSIDAPHDMPVSDLGDFFEGMEEASGRHGIANGGGNIREASTFSCHATVLGTVPKGIRLRRNGARPGDFLVAVGECGQFAAAYVKAKQCGIDVLTPEEEACISRPFARIAEMQILCNKGLANAASDNSDGVLGALWNIAEASDCSIEVDMAPEAIPESVAEAASEFGYNPWNFMFFWGDWQVIAAVSSDRSDEFWTTTKKHRIPVQYPGRVCKGPCPFGEGA